MGRIQLIPKALVDFTGFGPGSAFPVAAWIVGLSFFSVLVSAGTANAHLSIIRQGDESTGFREDWDRFGDALAYGDFNGDGYDDLATGSSMEGGAAGPAVGNVSINFGSPEGLTHVGALLLDISQFGLSANSSARFGHALATGDLNKDGYADLVVGVPGDDVPAANNAGRICVFAGGPNGPTAWFSYTQEDMNGFSQGWDYFGAALALGDFNGDTHLDLAVGSHGTGQQAGTVFVRYGTVGGPFGGTEVFTAEILGQSYQLDDYFGYALAVGNVIGNSHQDLVVGAPFRDAFQKPGAGVCYMIPGSSSGLVRTQFESFTASVADESNSAANFGMSLATAPVGTYDRLFIGEPDRYIGSVQRAGRVVAVMGSATGPNYETGVAYTRSLFDGVMFDDDRFGLFLDVGLFDDTDEFEDLIVGSPYLDWGILDHGVAHILPGGVNGIGESGFFVYTQVAIGEKVEENDNLGYAVSLGGQFDGTDKGHAVIGAPGEDGHAGLVHVVAPWRQFYFQEHKTACVMDCEGNLIFTQKPFERVYIASTTKIMTVLLACERASLPENHPDFLPLNLPYTVPDWVADDIGGSSANLVEGEVMTLLDLMHMALLISGNDAAHAIADCLYGSQGPWKSLPLFLARMNERADELGMSDTSFNNPNGFEQEAVGPNWGDHHSTAFDMALLSRAALQNSLFRDISTRQQWTAMRFQPGGGINFDTFQSFQNWILNNNMGVTGTGLRRLDAGRAHDMVCLGQGAFRGRRGHDLRESGWTHGDAGHRTHSRPGRWSLRFHPALAGLDVQRHLRAGRDPGDDRRGPILPFGLAAGPKPTVRSLPRRSRGREHQCESHDSQKLRSGAAAQ